MCFDILTYVKEPFSKTSFVRLISQHDSVYLMIVFTMLLQVMSLMDALSVQAVHLINIIYVPFVMYKVVKIMDSK